jgi:8-amino-7-oxononanoate synthase
LGRDYVVPIVLGNDEPAVRAALALQEAGYDIRAIRPPSVPPGRARLRISVHADHEPEMLAALAGAVGDMGRPS